MKLLYPNLEMAGGKLSYTSGRPLGRYLDQIYACNMLQARVDVANTIIGGWSSQRSEILGFSYSSRFPN